MNAILGVVLPPLVVALFVWWSSTGAIIALYSLSRRAQRGALLLSFVLCLALLWGLVALKNDTSSRAVYLSFVGGTLLWGWLLASYYLGVITGSAQGSVPATRATDSLLRRFWSALRASLYHELLIVATLLLLAVLLRDGANRWALWVMLTLWLMHSSGKLNVFFGVRNFRIEFLPAHMHFLDKFLEKKPINPFFPLSVFIASAVALTLAFRAFAPGVSAADTTGLLLISSMMALGLLEHWLLVLPLPKTIWGWGLRTLPNRLAGESTSAPSTAPIPEPLVE